MSVVRDTSDTFQMPAVAGLRALALRVRDLDAALGFYADVLGLPVKRREGGRVELAPGGGAFTLELVHAPDAPARPHPSIGLYHFALLLPDRPALAAVIRRLMAAGRPPDGASDHRVSEAFYLSDPEGNGIELYRDRPRADWPGRDGSVEMSTEPLDVAGLLAEAPGPGPLDPATRFGHIHLHVADLADGERFYAGALGLEVTQRSYSGALFLSAGGYHHHVGINLWARGRRAPEGAAGLVGYAWHVPPRTLGSLRAHLDHVEVPHRDTPAGVQLRDPAGVGVDVAEG
jgi:catechol 2,3-dioxygenase